MRGKRIVRRISTSERKTRETDRDTVRHVFGCKRSRSSATERHNITRKWLAVAAEAGARSDASLEHSRTSDGCSEIPVVHLVRGQQPADRKRLRRDIRSGCRRTCKGDRIVCRFVTSCTCSKCSGRDRHHLWRDNSIHVLVGECSRDSSECNLTDIARL